MQEWENGASGQEVLENRGWARVSATSRENLSWIFWPVDLYISPVVLEASPGSRIVDDAFQTLLTVHHGQI